jgi:hypothetical protein
MTTTLTFITEVVDDDPASTKQEQISMPFSSCHEHYLGEIDQANIRLAHGAVSHWFFPSAMWRRMVLASVT